MWIRRIEVRHCAGIAEGAVDLDRGLNVLHGPNELGKSTLVAALRAAFLLPATASMASALQDWNAQEPPEVGVTFEDDDGRIWRIRKTFATGSGGKAFLDASRDGEDFENDACGREVDGKLQGILRWGIEAPGGRGRRGMPSSLIATALLSDQSDVEAILKASLERDADDSGRDRLTEALQALAEDPRFKQVVLAAQAKVDEAFTPTGQKRRGRGSPWRGLADDRRRVEEWERDVRRQSEETTGVRARIEDVSEQLFDARADQQRLRDAIALNEARSAARKTFEVAEEKLVAAESTIGRLAANEAAAAVASERLQSLEGERAQLAGSLTDTASRAEAASARVRELESGDAEQRRRLREQERENQRLELAAALTAHKTSVEKATQIQGLENAIQAGAQDIERLEAALAEKRELLARAADATADDEEKLDALRLERLVARYRTAAAATEGLEQEREDALNLASRARTEAAEAAALREEVDALNAPDEAELDRLRRADDDRRLAAAKLSVGLTAELTLDAAVETTVDVDGDIRTLTPAPGTTTQLDAERELSVVLPGVATLRVRGGGRDLKQEADLAQTRWQAASRAVFGRTGCATLDELVALAQKADALRAQAEDLSRSADAAALRAEGLDVIEQRLATVRAERDQHASELAEHLKAGQTLDILVDGFDEPLDDDAARSDNIESLQARLHERQSLSGQMAARIEADESELTARRSRHGDRDGEFAERSAALEDWKSVLASAAGEGVRLERELGALEEELQTLRESAAGEVDEARTALETLTATQAQQRAAFEEAERSLIGARTELARLQGEAPLLRESAAGVDLDAIRTARDDARAALEALPPAQEGNDADAMAVAAAGAGRRVLELESELRKAEGALEQTGGQQLDEQREQAQEAAQALARREQELELDYQAWQLLHDTLSEAEKAGAAHLGSALVQPVSARVGDLTQGRYGEVGLGPQLDATGIKLAGEEREFTALSVGMREQIALVLRLAIAEALGTFVVLDDQLTQTDDDRMAWMRGLLGKAAEESQIIVMTCHPLDYEAEAPHRVVDLSASLLRSGTPVSGPS